MTTEDGSLAGILTHRDILFVEEGSRLVSDLMTPAVKVVTARAGVTVEEAKKLFLEHKVEKFPIVDDKRRLIGLITIADIIKRTRYPMSTKDAKGRLRVAAAVGVRGDYIERGRALADSEVDALVLDVAHDHSDQAIDAAEQLRKKLGDIELVVGKRGHRASRSGSRRARCGRDQGWDRPRLHLRDPGRHRLGRSPVLGNTGMFSRGKEARRSHHRRRRHQKLRRSNQSDCRRCLDRHAG